VTCLKRGHLGKDQAQLLTEAGEQWRKKKREKDKRTAHTPRCYWRGTESLERTEWTEEEYSVV